VRFCWCVKQTHHNLFRSIGKLTYCKSILTLCFICLLMFYAMRFFIKNCFLVTDLSKIFMGRCEAA
jgi:hypothetical protein